MTAAEFFENWKAPLIGVLCAFGTMSVDRIYDHYEGKRVVAEALAMIPPLPELDEFTGGETVQIVDDFIAEECTGAKNMNDIMSYGFVSDPETYQMTRKDYCDWMKLTNSDFGVVLP